MPGRDQDKDMEELEVTARPKSMPEELAEDVAQEPGLSIDTDDLGRHFLGQATEQHNYESARGGEAADLWVNTAAPSDDALPGPNFEGDRSVWENTVSLAMQSGGPDGASTEISPPAPDDAQDDGMRAIDREGDVDLTEPVIQEGLLLDHEGEELGETESPAVQTDDSRSHSKRRGGHPPKGARTAPRNR